MNVQSTDKHTLSSRQRKALRARAHALDPVVMIGETGLSAGVIAEIERSLKSHELIKIRVFGAERDDREDLMTRICAATNAQPVQHIGKILVVYRENPVRQPAAPARTPVKPVPAKPGSAKRLKKTAVRRGAPVTRSARRVSRSA